MAYDSRAPFPEPLLDVAAARTLADLAGLLRALRRRHAWRRKDSELTYRDIAARTGWSHSAIAEYLTGKTLPPIDRFDALVTLLGAGSVEQGALATARDRVAEHHRATRRRTTSRKPAARQPAAIGHLFRPGTSAGPGAAAEPDGSALAAHRCSEGRSLPASLGYLALLTGPNPLAALARPVAPTLTPAAARLFRLLGSHPGQDIAVPATASLAAVDHDEARALLAELRGADLVTTSVPGRYARPDLPHTYAHATRRVLDHYLHTAHAADRLLDPVTDPVSLGPPAPGVVPEPLADRQKAFDWFTAEHPVLLAAVTHATGARPGQLAWTLWTFLDRLGHWHDLAVVGRAAVAAADRSGDPAASARAHRLLAHAKTRTGQHTEARAGLRRALALSKRGGDLVGQADAHRALGDLATCPAETFAHAELARALYRATGHERGQASSLAQVGRCHAVLGNHRQALTCCRQALAQHQRLGDRPGQAYALDSLGHTHHRAGDHTRADTCYRHALALHHDLGDHYHAAVTTTHLGDTHLRRGDPGAAATKWRQALIMFDELEHADAGPLREKLASVP